MSSPGLEYKLDFVEADDEGWFWDPTQAASALSDVEQSVAERDTFVLVFVHGWNHSARCCDDNVEGFKAVLERVHAKVAHTMYPENSQAFRVIGIYVGWRGRSLKGVLNYLTFWGRKAAAERIGDADFQEFMNRLRILYERHKSLISQPALPIQPPHMLGLVTIGHSFGAQIVLRATSSFIEHRLAELTESPGYLRLHSDPSVVHSVDKVLTGFGDLVVLLNPAFEASAYGRLFTLGQQLVYLPSQTPVLLTISADNDWARGRAFRWGRVVGEWLTGKPVKADRRERLMEQRALGLFGEQVTHRIVPVDPKAKLEAHTLERTPDPSCAEEYEVCECEWYEWASTQATSSAVDSFSADDWTENMLSRVASFDFSARTVFNGIVLEPENNAIPYQALIVASADPAVIDGHSGIFSRPFIEFLTSYIGFVEVKTFTPLMHPSAPAAPLEGTH